MADTFKMFFDGPSGPVELPGHMLPMRNADAAAQWPGVRALRYDGSTVMTAADADGVTRPVTRRIQMKGRPSLHKCDARCLNASGRVMRCECSCGGVNHGRGAFVCEGGR